MEFIEMTIRPSILALASLSIATSANAADLSKLNPYIGADFQHTAYEFASTASNSLNPDLLLEDALNGFNIHAGVRPHKNIGLEVGFFNNFEENKSIANGAPVGGGLVATTDFSTDVSSFGFTVDAMGYLPIDKQERFELIGTTGISWTKAEITLNVPTIGNASASESEFGFRLGGGAQYKLSEKFNVRGMTRYQTADFSGLVDSATTFSVGLNYNF
jgi:opacity protein-like surface antigen